jgi:hypothetical protein
VIPESAYVAPSAVLCGAITLGERARVLHGAVLSAEDGEIWIGDDVVIMENALVRGRSRHPVSVGNAVLVLLSSSPLTSTRSCGGCRPSWTFRARSTGCRGAHRCVRSWRNRSSSMAPIETIRSFDH